MYRSTLRSLIHSLKYDGMLPVAEPLGRRLAERLLSLGPELPREMIVVPVPLHSSKRARKRFDHAELLARAAVREIKRQRPEWKLTLAANLLERGRETDSQAGLTPRQRRLNVRGAFSVPHSRLLTDAQVLLIDDIYTTGATARACTNALLRAGAASVWIATVARAQFEHIRPQLQTFGLAAAGRVNESVDLPMEEDVAFWDKEPAARLQHVLQ